MGKRFIVSVVDEEVPAPTEPELSVSPAGRRRGVVLTRPLFEWLVLKKIERGEEVNSPQGLATWMFLNGKRDDQLSAALEELCIAETARLRTADESPRAPAHVDPTSLLASLFSLHEAYATDELIAPAGPAARALAYPSVDLGRAFDLVDALRSYLLSRLTSTGHDGLLPLADLRLPDVDGDSAPAS